MRDSFNEINITPLTDIFLVLLIIMMVIAPLLDQQGLNLAVPEIVNEEQIVKDSKIIFKIEDKFLFNKKEYNESIDINKITKIEKILEGGSHNEFTCIVFYQNVTEVEEEPSHAKQSYCDVASRPICDAIWTMLFSEGLRHNSARRRQCQFVDHRS